MRPISALALFCIAMPWIGLAQEGDRALHPRVKIETSMGDLLIELDAEKAPITTNNFLQYVESGYYNGTVFHRVAKDFVVQGGGHTPDMKEKTEGQLKPIFNEWRNGLKNNRGTLSMARTQHPNSATSQFFINIKDNSKLDEAISGNAGYAVFAKIVEGMELIDKMNGLETREHPSTGMPAPVEPIHLKSATLLDGVTREQVAAAAAAHQARQIEALLAKAEAESGNKRTTTDSGLISVVMKAGTGANPAPTSSVSVHYTGSFPDGREFDSSRTRGQPAEFGLNQVIAGWTEGVGLMKVGERRLLVLPSKIAYGERGSRDVIPPDATLVFDIELLAIK